MTGVTININERTKHHMFYLIFPGLLGIIYGIFGILSFQHQLNMYLVNLVVLAIMVFVPIIYVAFSKEKSGSIIMDVLCSIFSVMQSMCLSLILTMFIYSIFTSIIK
jgi:hypothetical protein